MTKDTDSIEQVNANNERALKKMELESELSDLIMQLQFRNVPGIALVEDEDEHIKVYTGHMFDVQDGFENLLANTFYQLLDGTHEVKPMASLLAYTYTVTEDWFKARNIDPKKLDYESLVTVEADFSADERDEYAVKFIALLKEMQKYGYKSFVAFGSNDTAQCVNCMPTMQRLAEDYAVVYGRLINETEELNPCNLAIYITCMAAAWETYRDEQEAALVAGKA